MESNIIGRSKEKELLKTIWESDHSEFVAICGRRRVGKTFLIREFFGNQICFQVAGLANSPNKDQLKWFHQALCRYSGTDLPPPEDWFSAFNQLIDFLESLPAGRKVIFLDELPWFDTPKSSFIPALEAFWNSWASARSDIALFVCGSATSWMLDKLIHNHDGLYGRLTHRIFLSPFNLGEAKTFLQKKGFLLSDYETAICYMIFGGIPHYLNLLNPALSLTQNIDDLVFNPNGELFDEFSMLYAALFKNSDDYIKVVSALNSRGIGMTRGEILKATGLNSGSQFTKILANLEACGFIRKYCNYSSPSRDHYYQLIDFFTLFYFRFLSKSSIRHLQQWDHIIRSPAFYAWAGLTFELLILAHIPQLKRTLSIGGVSSAQSSWRSRKSDPAAQIDLLLDRNDNTINLCEIKFCENEYCIDKKYETVLRNKIGAFQRENPGSKSLQMTFISTFGVAKNQYSGILQNQVTLADILNYCG